MDAMENIKPVAIDHVGLAVADLDAAIDFHTRILGLELRHREENIGQGVAEAMLAPYEGLAPHDALPGATEIQLLAPLTPESPIAAFLDRSGPGMHHVAYRVFDVEASAATLRDHGLRLLYPEARPGTRGSMINFIHPKDAGGVLVELVQTAQNGHTLGPALR